MDSTVIFMCSDFITGLNYAVLQSQKAVSAYLWSKQILPFGFERQYVMICAVLQSQKAVSAYLPFGFVRQYGMIWEVLTLVLLNLFFYFHSFEAAIADAFSSFRRKIFSWRKIAISEIELFDKI